VRLAEGRQFVGDAALKAEAERGPARRLVALLPEGGIAREGCVVGRGQETAGRVTSGTFSPTLGRAIALALVSDAVWRARAGDPVWVEVRGRRLPAAETTRPFYRRRGGDGF
jgi:aminomethyltransferase